MTIRTHIGVRLTVVRLSGESGDDRVIAPVYYLRREFEKSVQRNQKRRRVVPKNLSRSSRLAAAVSV